MSINNIQATTTNNPGNTMEPTIKEYWDRALVRFATPELVHAKFGQERNIPRGNGTVIEFRGFRPLPAATRPLVEGVTPDGAKPTMFKIKAQVKQHGDYVAHTDILPLTAFDKVSAEFTKLLGEQAGRTLDVLCREYLNAGTNVQYHNGALSSRAELTASHALTVDAVRKAVRVLKRNNAKPYKSGYYAAIIHPDVAIDLMSDPEWIRSNTTSTKEEWEKGSIGKVAGVIFYESTQAKLFRGDPLKSADSKYDPEVLTVAKVEGSAITLAEELTAAEASALGGRKVQIDSYVLTVSGATAGDNGTITLAEALPLAVKEGAFIYPAGGGTDNVNIYSTLFIGADAYGVTELAGGGLTSIVKPLGSGGTEDPLNQRGTAGWKATHVTTILTQEFMLRVETASSFGN